MTSPPPPLPYHNVWMRHWKVGERGTEEGGKVELGLGFPFSSSIPRAVSSRSLLYYWPFFFTKESGPRLSLEWNAGYTWMCCKAFLNFLFFILFNYSSFFFRTSEQGLKSTNRNRRVTYVLLEFEFVESNFLSRCFEKLKDDNLMTARFN